MATLNLSAKITIISGQNQKISNISSIEPLNNVSSNLGNVNGIKRIAKNPFIIGASKVGDDSSYFNSLDYIVFRQLSDPTTGKFATPIEFTIKSNVEDIDHFTIQFDTINKNFPSHIIVDGETYEDDDPSFTIANLTGNEHTIKIEDWNKKGFPCVITAIYTGINIEVDGRNIINISREIKDRSDFYLPSYGVIAGNGEMSFNDVDTNVLDYAKLGILKSDLDVEVFMNEKLSKTNMLVGKFKTDKWDYDNLNFKVSVSLKDDLLEWQSIPINGIQIVPYSSFNGIKFFDTLKSFTPQKFVFEELSQEVKNHLTNITIQNFYRENSNLWAYWNKFCETALVRIYKNNQGKIEVKL